jgi:hypothetical protein
MAQAQSVGSPGSSWSGGWSFSSGTDRSIALQQAQMIRQAEGGVEPSSVYNTYNDSRSNYIESNSAGGEVAADLHIGDEIGENTYAVGSLNTGSTTITVDGDGNLIDANNSSETNGCVDGSIASGTPVFSSATPESPTAVTYIPVVLPCQ